MASIITATVSSGLTQQADNSGVLQLASGTGNLVTVPSVTGTAMVSGNMPAFSAYKSGNQNLSSSNWTKVTYETEEYDTNNNFASSRFTPTVAGYYQINAGVYTSGSSNANTNRIAIYKNGALYKHGCWFVLSTSVYGQGIATVSILVNFNGSTDYVEVYSYTEYTSPIAYANEGTYFQGVLVRSS
jgi:hypothetical protein